MEETIAAIKELNEHPETVFTVLTGEGRFFSAGADVRGELSFTSQQNSGAKSTDHVH
jgi:peroxisomal 3,2-trans-enoyl-CoA isomerase